MTCSGTSAVYGPSIRTFTVTPFGAPNDCSLTSVLSSPDRASPARPARSASATGNVQRLSFMVLPFGRPWRAAAFSECETLTPEPPQRLVAATPVRAGEAVEQPVQPARAGAGVGVRRAGRLGAGLVIPAVRLDRRPLRQDGRRRRGEPSELGRPVGDLAADHRQHRLDPLDVLLGHREVVRG